jgi:flavin reductase (DIM6/NTAB) family NADH-FMN oxidoreductase RutF
MMDMDLKSFRQCLGQFATGVTVVTCTDQEGNGCGITANSFSSVSLEPPLVLWNIAKSSNSLRAYLKAEFFGVNVLTSQQQPIASHFAQSDHKLFDDIQYSLSSNSVPTLPDTLAHLECRTTQIHSCGDHYIIIGEVENYRLGSGSPLLFFAGNYAAID